MTKLKKGLEKYYTEVLRISHTNIVDHIELSAIARSSDKTNLMYLFELVMGVVVKCPAKEAYISRILSLEERFQAELMVFIQKIINKIERKSSHEMDPEGRVDVQQLRQENRSLNLQLEELQNSLDEIAQKQGELLGEKEALIKQLKSFETEMDKKSSKKFPGDLNLTQLEAQLSQRDNIIQELRLQNNEIKKQHENEISNLRDELDVAHEKILNQSKTEATLEVYKKRLEDSNIVKKKMQDLEKENKSVKEHLKQYEEDILELENLKNTLNYFKDQHTIEKERVAEVASKLEEKERLLKEVTKYKDEINQKKVFLENKVKEMQFENENLRYRQDSGRGDEEFSLQKNITAEYEEQIARLEQENKRLRTQASGEGIIKEINAQLDRVLIEKKNAEEKANHEKRENLDTKRELEVLKREISQFKDEANGKIGELTSDLSISAESNHKLQVRLAEIEKEKTQLEHVSSENERLKKERENHMQEMKSLFKDKDEVQQKVMEGKDEIHKLQHALGQKEVLLKAAEIEREKIENRLNAAMESERIATSELQILKNKTEVTDSSAEKIKFLELERDKMKLNSEISNLRLNLREKDDQIHQLQNEKSRKILEITQESSRREEELKATYHEELENIKKDIALKASEISYLNKNREEITNSWNKEMKLMSIVVHEVGMDIIRANRTLKEDKSWLNSKRATKN